MNKKTLLLLIIIHLGLNYLYSQSDKIYYKDGKIIVGEFISIEDKNVTFIPKFANRHSYYNTDFINLVKSWNGDLIYPQGVLVNIDSKKYHLSNVEHAKALGETKFFDDAELAKNHGYKPCGACYKTSPNIPDYYLEKYISEQTKINIKITSEILYNHPNLKNLKKIVKSVLDNWPEKLKGYDYLVHIVKDDNINAFAIPGGHLYFNTGMLDVIEDELELESVVAHEIAHIERRHGLRQWRKRQANTAFKNAAVLLSIGAALSTGDDSYLIAGAVLDDLGQLAIEILQKGYTREHEQESDILAQIYFENMNKDKMKMVALLDKLAVNTITNAGYISSVNAYSNHPNILSRIEQVKSSERIHYDNELNFNISPIIQKTKKKSKGFKFLDVNDVKRYKIDNNFLTFSISDVFVQKSSNKKNNYNFLLLGNIRNNHRDIGFSIDEIKLNFFGSLGILAVKGLVNVIAPRNGEIDFSSYIECSADQKDVMFNSFKNKNFVPFSTKASAVVMEQGKPPLLVKNMDKFNCNMTIN